ncbi:MAG: hypothetical protein L3J62_10590 [Gammaproteobacteria bacterium]|nr:hypothetical protein [Gammaproteobacteria bacterium]
MNTKTDNHRPNDTTLWDNNRGVMRSGIGGWKVGEAVYNHGYSMMDDFVGKLSYMQVVALNATGRLPKREFADWVEQVHICMSWPDSRVWCNQIGALSGTSRTTAIAATCAGVLANDSRTYGSKTGVEGVKFIQSALRRVQSGCSVEQLIEDECAKRGGKPNFMGYARPIAKGDVRIMAMEKVQKTLNMVVGEHQKLAYKISDILLHNFDESLNFNGYLCAVFSDHGFDPVHSDRMFSILVSSGVTACYVDAMSNPPESFFTQRCEDINYAGKAIRTLEEDGSTHP